MQSQEAVQREDAAVDGNELGDAVETDGVWAWPQDLRYYLDAHNVRLPADFLAHMLAADFSVPPDVALDRLVLPSGEA